MTDSNSDQRPVRGMTGKELYLRLLRHVVPYWRMFVVAVFAMVVGILIVFIGRYTLAKLPNVKTVDAIATAGLFGAVSGSTLAAGLTLLETEGIDYEAWAAALYPFTALPDDQLLAIGPETVLRSISWIPRSSER